MHAPTLPPGQAASRRGRLAGAAAVIRDDQRVATLGPGDFFGEVGLLSTTWRVATVEALSPMRLLVIGPREFQTMMLTLPSVAEHVAQTAAERNRQASGHARTRRTATTSTA